MAGKDFPRSLSLLKYVYSYGGIILDYTINRKKREVVFRIGDSEEAKSFEETWSLIYLLMRKMASTHRA